MNILVISALDIWSMGKGKGAPSLYMTLKGYADKGHKVFFLTSGKLSAKYGKIHENIYVHRFTVPFPAFLKNVRKAGILFRPVWWALFQLAAYMKGIALRSQHGIDLFYGYEIYGVPVSAMLARRFGKPVISRFQGTILAPKMKRKFWKLRFWEHIKAMLTPVDMMIMADDGTRGDKVLETLKVDMDKVKFWMNGVARHAQLSDAEKEVFMRECGVPAGSRVMLSASRLQRWKRIDRIVSIMPGVTKTIDNVMLLIIGGGEEKAGLERTVAW